MTQKHLSAVCDIIDEKITGDKFQGLRTLAHAYAAHGLPEKVRDICPDLEMAMLSAKDVAFPLGFVVSVKTKSSNGLRLRPLFSVIHKGSISHPDEENVDSARDFIYGELNLDRTAKDVVHLYPLFDRLKLMEPGLWKVLTDTVVLNEKDMRYTVRLANGIEADLELSINYGTLSIIQAEIDTLNSMRTESGRMMTMGEVLLAHLKQKGLK